MFNHEAYQQRLDELKEEIRGMVMQFDQANLEFWHKDVSLRYGRFLAQRGHEQMQRVIDILPGYDHVDDKQKHRDHCAAELMGCVASIHASSAMIRGAVLVADPIGAEGMMRIYDEANAAPKQTAPAPMVAESDDSYRPRVWIEATEAHASSEAFDRLLAATGATLDAEGRKYGVLRAMAPAAP